MIAWLGFPKNPRFEAPGHVKRDKVFYLTERFKSPAMEVLLNVEFGAPIAAQMKSPLERMCGQKFKSRWHVRKVQIGLEQLVSNPMEVELKDFLVLVVWCSTRRRWFGANWMEGSALSWQPRTIQWLDVAGRRARQP